MDAIVPIASKSPKCMPGPKATRVSPRSTLQDWEEVARVRNPAGPDDSADFSYVTYRRRSRVNAALTALANVYIDNYGLRHSCFEP